MSSSQPSSSFLLTELDLHLLREGTHWQSYRKLGAHLREVDGKKGVNFAVWAPNASAVSVIGEFNNWDGNAHPMNNNAFSGFWEIFIPDVAEWATYKYLIKNLAHISAKSMDKKGSISPFGHPMLPQSASSANLITGTVPPTQ